MCILLLFLNYNQCSFFLVYESNDDESNDDESNDDESSDDD